MKERLVLGTRGSQLALWQANHVAEALRAAWPGLVVELTIIKTSGDRIQDKALREIGGKGLFVKEIEEAMLAGEIDAAVHSMKDVPAGLPAGLTLAGMMERASAFDALITMDGRGLGELPASAVVGTGSLRRQFQLLALRPDLQVRGIRGNVDTRLRKLAEGEDGLAAIVLAEAGLSRLGWGARVSQRLTPPEVIPAIGQGALGLETREDDAATRALIAPLRHGPTEAAVRAERGVLVRLQGDCHLPIAAWAEAKADGSGALVLMARLGAADGSRIFHEALEVGAGDDPHAAGVELAERLLAAGADALLGER